MAEIGSVCPAKKAPRGRPIKKPGYDREREIQELIEQAVTLVCYPFDDRCDRDSDAPTIKDVAEEMHSTPIRVRKLLITADYYSTAASREVQKLSQCGCSIREIMEKTGLNQTSVYSYLPYKKGAYNLKDPTLYAERCRRLRSRKKACDALACHLDHPEVCKYLWNAIQAFEGYPFQMGKERFKYSLDQDKLKLDWADIPRCDINSAFRKIRKLLEKGNCQITSEDLGCCGAKELLTVLIRIGACKEES